MSDHAFNYSILFCTALHNMLQNAKKQQRAGQKECLGGRYRKISIKIAKSSTASFPPSIKNKDVKKEETPVKNVKKVRVYKRSVGACVRFE